MPQPRTTMNCRTLWLALILPSAAYAAAPTNELALWPQGLPAGARTFAPEEVARLEKATTAERIAYVGAPSLTLYPAPKDKANGCAVVICPGGGYNILAWAKEGVEIAAWLNSLGVTAAVLKYRVPRRDKDTPHTEPLQDAQRAIRLVRKHAKAWNVDPHRIGLLGFSAGGHLTIMAGTHWDTPAYAPVDDADRLPSRPDFLIPIYAAYLGDTDDPTTLSPLVRITARTPPTFLAVTHDDKLRGLHAALLFVELKKAGVPAELHIYSKGGHGYGIRPSANPVSTWHDRCAEWMRVTNLLEPVGR